MASEPAGAAAKQSSGWRARYGQVVALVRAIGAGEEAAIEAAVLELSRSRRIFAPLAFAVGAFVMLFRGVKLLVVNWRLLVVESLPAFWIWAAMLDLKLHVLHGRELNTWYGGEAVVLVLLIAVVTTAAFYLNAVFAFAIADPGRPHIRPAFAQARRQAAVIVAVGFALGVALGVAAIVSGRWGRWWFTISLGVVVGAMMVAYVSVPSRLIGMKADLSRRDKLAASAIAGMLGALVCTPPYAIGRVGVLLLESRALAVGVILLAIGIALQAGATGAVKAIKMSAKLIPARAPAARSPTTTDHTTKEAP
jgi:hypothetical protein